MAGDWMPVRLDLVDDPAVIAIAAAVGLDEYAVVGRLVRIWGWANRHLASGDARSVTPEWVDRHLSAPGFAAAMEREGWLRFTEGGGEFPNFERWNTSGAKNRLQSARRMAEHRRRHPPAGGSPGDASVTLTASPEKRTEEKNNTPLHPVGGSGGAVAGKDMKPVEAATTKRRRAKAAAVEPPGFADFYAAYPRKVGRQEAAKAFARLAPGPELLATILAGVCRYTAHVAGKDAQHVKHPSGWLNGRRWEDDLGVAAPSVTTDPADMARKTAQKLAALDRHAPPMTLVRSQGRCGRPRWTPVRLARTAPGRRSRPGRPPDRPRPLNPSGGQGWPP